MSEYWLSLPKRYCKVCECWFSDNNASVDSHNRGLRHQGNVRKKLNQMQKESSRQAKELKQYNTEMMKIEAAAMKAFKNDVAKVPSMAKEYATTPSVLSKLKHIPTITDSPNKVKGRFGIEEDYEESSTLVFGREKALDTISKKLEKKHQWLEAHTAEGKSYYWNKKTMETKWSPPKCGYLSLDEQKALNITQGNDASTSSYKYEPLGPWKVVEDKPYENSIVDLEFPKNEVKIKPYFVSKINEDNNNEIKFEEKTVISLDKTSGPTAFKKRKIIPGNMRSREND